MRSRQLDELLFTYSLEERGLESVLIRKQLGDLIDRFGWHDAAEQR